MKRQGFFFQLMAAIMASGLPATRKQSEASKLNKQTGGALFSNGPMPMRFKNQRQRRKLNRQTQNFK